MGSCTDPTPRRPMTQWAEPENLGNHFTCVRPRRSRGAGDDLDDDELAQDVFDDLAHVVDRDVE